MDNSESQFSFAKWQDEKDVASNPVESKIRRDWLSQLLFDKLDGYQVKDDVDEWEFLDHYADAIFVECLSLTRHYPIAVNVDGILQVEENSGWSIGKTHFADMFNDESNLFARHFIQWLRSQGERASAINDELLGIYCNEGEASLNKFKIKELEAPFKVKAASAGKHRC